MSDKTSDVEFSSAPSPHLSKVITEINSSVDSPKYTDDSVSLHFSEFNDSSEASSAKNDGLKGDSEGKRESKTRSFTKMFYSPTSLFMFATGLALVITGYRYSSYEALKGYREDCRAIAASGQTISQECAKVLLGSILPPQFRTSSTNPSCSDFDEEIFTHFVLRNTDDLFPRFWQFLLFRNGVQSGSILTLYSMLALPSHILAFLIPAFMHRQEPQKRQFFFLRVSGWMAVYLAVGLTGAWLELSKGILYLLNWGSDKRGFVQLPARSWMAFSVCDFTIVTGTTAYILRFGQHKDSSHSKQIPPIETNDDGNGTENEKVEEIKSESHLFTTVASRRQRAQAIMASLIIVLTIVRLIPAILHSGPNVLIYMLAKLGISIAVEKWIGVHQDNSNSKTSPRKKAFIFVATILAWAVVQFADEYCAARYHNISLTSQIDRDQSFWATYFCQKKQERQFRNSFMTNVQRVILSEEAGEDVAFNTTLLRKLHQHPLIGDKDFPEPWCLIREFLWRTVDNDHQDWAWVRNEL